MDTVMELEIGPGPEPGSYVVRVLRSVGGGEPIETITLDLDDLVHRRPLLEASVLSSSVSARRVMSDTEAAIQDIGQRLFESAFSGEVRTAYRTSMAVASERGKNVQIALRLTAPGLAALPWETLFDAQNGSYICRKEPLVRHVPAPYSPAALALEPPLRVLGMIASPHGLPMLDIAGERERLEGALRPHLESGRVELEWLDEVTWQGVHGKLLEQEWHVLHFIGHGTYDTETDEGVLAFVAPDGRADYVTASSLADLVDEAEPTPRLVILNSCQSGAASTTDLFSGTAAALARSGVRAVAAMQFSISDVAAIAFARGFYTALAYGRGIDEAVRSGRIGILGISRGTLEWVTPVLYLRGEDAHLFDVAKPVRTGRIAAPTAEPQPEPTPESVIDVEIEPEPAPDIEIEPDAEPRPERGPAAESAPEPEAEVEAELAPEPEPTAEAEVESKTELVEASGPEPEPTSELGRSAAEDLQWWAAPMPFPEAPAPRRNTRPPKASANDQDAPGREANWKPLIVVTIVAALAIVGIVVATTLNSYG